MQKIRIIAIAVLFCFLMTPYTLAVTKLSGTADELLEHLSDMPQLVSISGESEIKVQADRAIASIKIATKNESLQKAWEENNAIRNGIVKKLQAKGISPDDVKGSKFSSTPETGYFSDKVKKYLVENIIKITLKEEAQFKNIAAIVDNMKEVSYLSVEFESSREKELENKALKQACENAVAKKQIYEQTLAVKLTPHSFMEQLVSHRTDSAVLGDELRSSGRRAVSKLRSAQAHGTQFDEIVFFAHIVVNYKLEPSK